MAVIKKDGNIMALPLSISRGYPIALDATQVWYDKTAMESYAQTDPTAYPGQFLTYVNETGSTVEAYVIANTAGTLVKLASTTASGDVSADIIALQGRCTELENRVTTIEEALEGVSGFEFEVVESLPATGEKGKIYLVAHNHGEKDIYDEYIWTDTAYEKIGSTNIDLSSYYTKSETDTQISEAIAPINTALEGKQASSANLTALAALAGEGLVRRKSDDTFVLDTTAYLTATALEPYATTEALGAIEDSVQANTDAIAAINDTETGILAQAKAYADDNVYDDTSIKTGISNNSTAISALSTDVDNLKASVTSQETSIQQNTTSIGTINSQIEAINDAETGIYATAKTYTDNKTATNKTLIDALDGRISTVETTLTDKAAQSALQAEIDRAKAAEKKNEDAINLILDNPSTETIDSIKELTEYVEKDGATTASLVNRLAGIGGENEPATVMAAIEAATYNLPVATTTSLGGIKASASIAVAADGEATVAQVSTDVLIQGDNELILNGGSAQ